MFTAVENMDISGLNPITYAGEGLFGPDHRLLTITLKRHYLVTPNLVTLGFYLLGTFWLKIDLPRGLLQLFLK